MPDFASILRCVSALQILLSAQTRCDHPTEGQLREFYAVHAIDSLRLSKGSG